MAMLSGKANLSEFAFFRGNLPSGWSGRGGQTTNAYFPSADPCGSSSGSGVAASIGLATVTLVLSMRLSPSIQATEAITREPRRTVVSPAPPIITT
jgi:hypothetical protein